METVDITEIGSLPYHNVDAAIEHAFQVTVPFLPQIPARHPSEFMVYQAMDGLPGLKLEAGGYITLDMSQWDAGAHALNQKLERIFGRGSDSIFPSSEDLEPFAPPPGSWSCWQPFLWEIEERKIPRAKAQIAGPITCQWVAKLPADVSTQIIKFILARALCMAHKIRDAGAKPLIFFDEPGLSVFTSTHPQHRLALQELKLSLRVLKNFGAESGLHCCSNSDWPTLLALEPDWLSIDTHLSLTSLLGHTSALEAFLAKGGRLALGAIPTDPSPEVSDLLEESAIRSAIKRYPKILSNGLLITPACGLALVGPERAVSVLGALKKLAHTLQNSNSATTGK